MSPDPSHRVRARARLRAVLARRDDRKWRVIPLVDDALTVFSSRPCSDRHHRPPEGDHRAPYRAFDAAYRRNLTEPFPVRTMVGSQFSGIVVEIDAVAVVEETG